MSADIGQGDWVECIDVKETYGLTEGAIYQVRAIEPTIHPDNRGELVLLLVGFPAQGEMMKCGLLRAGYSVWRFRPAFGGHEATIRAETTPADVREPTKVKV